MVELELSKNVSIGIFLLVVVAFFIGGYVFFFAPMGDPIVLNLNNKNYLAKSASCTGVLEIENTCYSLSTQADECIATPINSLTCKAVTRLSSLV